MTAEFLDLVVDRLSRRVSAGDPLTVEFATWLGVCAGEPPSSGTTSGLWYPRDVAMAGLREASGRAYARPFTEGLAVLRRREFFTPYSPGTFEADPLAIISVAVGIRHAADQGAAMWIAGIAQRAMEAEMDVWRVGLLKAAVAMAGVEPARSLPPELAVALTSKGIGCFDEDTATIAMSGISALDEPPADRAAVRLAALQVLTVASFKPNVSLPIIMISASQAKEPFVKDKVTILFVAANPMTTSRLELAEEQRDIQGRIREARYRDSIEMAVAVAARPDDLELALLEHKPVIVHFSGHGSSMGGLVFQDDTGQEAKLINADAIGHLFSLLKKKVRVVVLNSCYSEFQANAIAREIDFVVGMRNSIGDMAARKFAASFYRGLGFGESVEIAFGLGINALKREGLVNDVNVPVLLVRSGASSGDSILGS